MEPQKKKQSPTDFFKYSGMGLQMAAIMGGSAFGGHWIDTQLSLKIPIFTLVLSLAGVFFALWYFIRDFLKKK
jgi:4-hydroxybenzoate polyprenyltransferase